MADKQHQLITITKFVTRLLKIAQENGSKVLEGNAHEALGISYQVANKNKKAIEHYEKHLKISKQMKDKKSEGNAYDRLGDCYASLSQYEDAIEHYKMHLNIAKQTEDNAAKGKAIGDLGICYCSLGQYDKAIEHFKMLLNIAKQMGDKAGEGAAIGNLGTCYRCLGQYYKAIEYFEMHLNIAKQIGDKAGEGSAIGNLGSYYICLGLYDKAIEHCEMHLNIAKQIGDKAGEGKAIGNLGTCYRCLGQYSKAIEHFEMHLNIAKQIGDKAREGSTLGKLGTCYRCLGQCDKAIKHFEMHLNIAKQIGDKAGEGSTLANLGICYLCLGQYDKALEHFEMHLNIAEQIGDKAGEGSTVGNLGTCYRCLGQYDKAIEHFEMHLNIAKQIGDKAGEGNAVGNLGTCYRCLGQYDKAIEHFKMHLNIAKQTGDKAGEGNAIGNLGNCYRYRCQYDKAIEHFKMHLNIAEQIGDKAGEGGANGNLGNCYSCLGQYNKAIEYHEMHLNIAKQIGDIAGEGKAQANIGNCYFYMHEQYDRAEEYYKESVDSFEKLFKNAPQQDQFKVSIQDTFIDTYRQLVTTLVCKEKKEEALVIAERGRSRALTELLVNARHPKRPTNPSAKDLELDEIIQLVKALDKTVIYFSLLEHDICTWVIQRDGNGIDVLPQDLNCQFGDVSISRLTDLLSLIEKATKLLNPCGVVKCEDRSLSFLYHDESKQTTGKRGTEMLSAISPAEIPVGQQSSQCKRVPSPAIMECKQAAKTRSPESKCREDMEASELRSVLKDLFQILVSSALQFVKGSQVIVVPDGPLPLVPFVALIDGDGHYVAETLQVRLVPSLATAKMAMERPEEPDIQSSPLIVGDPDVDRVQKGKETKYPIRLPFAKKEAEKVGRILGVEPFTAEKATKESFLQNVEHANLIHIASHADMDRGEILLAPSPGNESRKFEDVVLTVTDLEHKRLRAKLVVLSCCHSGQGEVRAEGVIGIGRAFLGAGARAVLVTLWAVDDEATMYFMTKFYQHLNCGKRANGALNEAMKAMRGMEKFRHPRHWAPFVLIGEDVALFDKGGL